jgi:acyl carrier protein
MDTIAYQGLIEPVTQWVLQNRLDPLGDAGSVTPETDVLASGLLDSLGLVNLVAYIESLLHCRIDLRDIDFTEFTTIRGLCGHAVRSRDGMRQGGGDE